jgi:peptidoglycan hydrolase-like protein with peptidoglycan-binding domain
MTPDRIKLKDKAFTSAWIQRFATPPSLNCRVLALSVAIHETGAGDSWAGPDGVLDTADDERNWGSSTLRALNAAELEVVRRAGVVPTVGPGHETAARAAQAAIVAAGLPLPQGVIHCDSSPLKGPYFVYFASFPTDEQGADYFIRALCLRKDGSRKPAYSVLDTGNEQSLASAMYAASYFLGFHKPKPPGGPLEKAAADQANIDDYASALRALSPKIRLALTSPIDIHIVLRRTLRLGSSGEDVAEWQGIVGAVKDGVFGPQTLALTRAWQARHGLVADGIVGPATWAESTKHSTEPNMEAVRDDGDT